MVFSSVLFLFLFLPAVLCPYFFLPRALRNGWLLLASLFFYAWGETFYVGLMLLSIAMNYGFGLAIDRSGKTAQRAVVAIAVAANLAFLAFFKYANFLVDNLNLLIGGLGLQPIGLAPVHLPIGISFFTFQAMSYVIDLYRKDAGVQRNPFHLGLYIALFPQLIAGPIVRYHDIAAQIRNRRSSLEDVSAGIQRFIIGLAKKVMLANTFAVPADAIFGLPAHELTAGAAWLGAICYTFQIYFDFSGYSDMAIGLGRMFGFRFLENFQWPYIAQSIREFWRRWHISLSTWFRDYLYIPLGGNRGGFFRTSFNLVIVFFLCGLWHGASWNFAIWGLYHGAFLVLERSAFGRAVDRAWRPMRHAYVLFVALIGWVFFRAETLPQSLGFLAAMFGGNAGAPYVYPAAHFMNNQLLFVIVIALPAATPLLPWIAARCPERGPGVPMVSAVVVIACVTLLAGCALLLSAQTHNPFIYFRF